MTDHEAVMKGKIGSAFYRILKIYDACPEVLALAGSYGDTLSDDIILELMEDWIKDRKILHARH
jgi:hypothetical protein